MGLQGIRQRLEKLCWRLLMGAVENVPERNQTLESGSYARARYKGPERRLAIPCEVKGHATASPVSVQGKANIARGASAPAKKHVSPGDVARGIIGPNSGAAISNVLVVGTEGSSPLKRMEIHFDDPEQVPAVFNLLAEALQTSGFDFHAARSSGIPTTEIWLTCPLDDPKKMLLSCAALIREHGAAGVAVQASPRNQTK